MRKFIVIVREEWSKEVAIEANSASEALGKVQNGQGVESEPEYHETMDDDTWSMKEVDDKGEEIAFWDLYDGLPDDEGGNHDT